MEGKVKDSYRKSVASSFWIGGSSAVNVVLGALRGKMIAVCVGADGLGLFGILSSVTSLMGSVAGLGFGSSGVRQIAEATGMGDEKRITRIAVVLRRMSICLGLFGALIVIALSVPISRASFGDRQQVYSLMMVAPAVFFTVVGAGESALIQGRRRTRELAQQSIWGGILGTALSIPLLIVLGEPGIAALISIVAAAACATAWRFASRLRVEAERIQIDFRELWIEGKALFRMGIVLMSAGAMSSAVAYLTRVMTVREISLEAAGLYHAAWTLAGVYVGFILNAMATDYYPRLTASATDHEEVNRIVNEQTEIALLMAVPGILATLTLAPWVLRWLYAPELESAAGILRWQTMGVLGRVISWPLAYVLLAKGFARTFFWIEFASHLLHLSLMWVGVKWFGLDGLGMAFCALYVCYLVAVFLAITRITAFVWTAANVRLIRTVCAGTMIVFVATSGVLSPIVSAWIGVSFTLAAATLSLRTLAKRSGFSGLRGFMSRSSG